MQGVRHAPQREAPDALLRVAADFATHLFIEHREGNAVNAPSSAADLAQSTALDDLDDRVERWLMPSAR
jgi:hypothetical protein